MPYIFCHIVLHYFSSLFHVHPYLLNCLIAVSTKGGENVGVYQTLRTYLMDDHLNLYYLYYLASAFSNANFNAA